MSDPSPAALSAWQAPTLHRSRHAGPRRVRRSPLAYLLPIHLAQVIVWQLAVLAAIGIAWSRPYGPRTVVVLGLAGLAVLATSVRVHGRCGYDWLAARVAFHRSRDVASPPDLDLRTHTDRLGNRTGLAGLGATWSAAIRLRDPGWADTTRLVAVLDEYFRHSEVRLAAAQLSVCTVATPNGPRRTFWLAVRYDPARDPRAAQARGGGELGALRTTASAAHRLARQLDDAGYFATVLEEGELREQLRWLAGPVDAVEARESWHAWQIGASRQRCYRPSHGTSPTVVLDRYPPGAVFTCVSYTLRHRSRDRVAADVLLRLGDGDPRQVGVPLDPVNGRHLAAVRETLPLAL